MVGDLATALAGSSDVYPPPATRTVNFIAAHDGMTLADLTAYEHKHNNANGEHNRDGHDDNLSWNNGVEGPTATRHRAARADPTARPAGHPVRLRGTIMLTAGDEFGRTQSGNNNAYAQDNPLTWLDWTARDCDLEAFAATLAALRRAHPALADPTLLTGAPAPDGIPDVAWLTPAGHPKNPEDWQNARGPALAMVLGSGGNGRLAVLFNRSAHAVTFHLPPAPATPGPRRRRVASPSAPRRRVRARTAGGPAVTGCQLTCRSPATDAAHAEAEANDGRDRLGQPGAEGLDARQGIRQRPPGRRPDGCRQAQRCRRGVGRRSGFPRRSPEIAPEKAQKLPDLANSGGFWLVSAAVADVLRSGEPRADVALSDARCSATDRRRPSRARTSA